MRCWLMFLLVAGAVLAFASGQEVGPAASPSSSEFEKLLNGILWVAYAPTQYDPEVTPPILPSEDSIRVDLRALRAAGFGGLITYGAQLPAIVSVAEEEGFRAVLLGVWDPGSGEELRAAKLTAGKPIVIGVIVGNEGLMFRRYDSETLRRGMEEIRRDTGKPVSTTETVEYFYTRQDLVNWSDFLTVNAHPYFHGHRDPVRAVDWTLSAWDRLKRHVTNKPVLFKEVGLPTAGATENSEASQGEYYRRLLTTTDVQFAFFEGFDALFKIGAVEKSWGIFRADRSPKPAAESLVNGDSCSGPLLRVWCEK